MKSTIKKKFDFLALENLFIIIGLIFGLILVFVNPPWQSNDEDRHYYISYKFSEGEFIPKYESAINIPRNVVRVTQSFQGLPFHNGTKINSQQMKELEKIPVNSKDRFIFSTPNIPNLNPAYIPNAIGILIGRILKPYPVWTMWFGRMGGLFFYLIIMYLVIRLTPIFKGVFFVFGLSPMVLFQSASITYDTMSTVLCFMTIALTLRYALIESETLNLKNTLLVLIVIIFAQLSKGGYILLPIIMFIVPLKKFGGWAKLIPFFIFFALLYFFENATINSFVASINPLKVESSTGAAVMQNDFEGNSSQMVSYFVSKPFEAIDIAIKNILMQRENWIGGIMGRFGYSYLLLPIPILILQWIVIIVVAFFESKSEYKLNILQKTIILAIGIISYFLIIFGMWAGSSPLGAKMVFGLQGRYFVPIVPVLLLFLYNSQYEIKSWHKWKGIILSIYSIAILIYTVTYMNDYYYSN